MYAIRSYYDTAVDLYVSLGPWAGVDETPPLANLNISPHQINLKIIYHTIFKKAHKNLSLKCNVKCRVKKISLAFKVTEQSNLTYSGKIGYVFCCSSCISLCGK